MKQKQYRPWLLYRSGILHVILIKNHQPQAQNLIDQRFYDWYMQLCHKIKLKHVRKHDVIGYTQNVFFFVFEKCET